ncbi:MAG: paraquat-inducible protein A [Pseudomonadota bacterium]
MQPGLPRTLVWANLALLALYPLAWWAPLMRASVLPFFGGDEISILSGIGALWRSDVVLALIVLGFAVLAPLAKTLALAAVHWRRFGPRALPALEITGKLAMADVFLVALFIVIAKGVSLTRIETAWGLYLFTACVLASMALTQWTRRALG